MYHVFRFRDYFGLACHAPEVMARIRVVSFNRMCIGFANDMPFWRQNLGKGIPIVRIKYAVSEMFYFVI